MTGTILITGANGFIGSRLAELAEQRGFTVRTLTRSDWSGRPAVLHSQRYFGTLPNDLPGAAFKDVNAVIHCAAALESDERVARAVNVVGTLALARLAAAAGVKEFVFLSTQSAKATAVSVYGRTKFAAEEALKKVPGIHSIILRPGLVCGDGSRGLFQRMCGMVQKLPILPLLGGGKAPVQPIALDDLCEAILRCVERGDEFAGATLHLGAADGLPLAEFLQQIALARHGRRKIAIHIPLWPIEAGVKCAEAVRIPLPINSNNLQGLKAVEIMPSGPDLARLQMTLRPVSEMVMRTPAQLTSASAERRAARIILIGAGRIGVVHALTLSRLRGVDFAGIVDTKKSQLGMLRGMGLKTPMFRSLDEAITAAKPDAALIATPASSHLSLARACMRQGLSVLVEKPLALRPEELEEFSRLAAEHPRLSIQVGYVMPRNPQVETMVRRLRTGDFGTVQQFLGLTLHSHVLDYDPNRWETKKSISGGGVLINSGGHVLSMILDAFGPPKQIAASSLAVHSTEVEDSMVLRFDYEGFSGTHCASWSIPGFQRQENRLVVQTTRGTVVMTASMGLFIPIGSSPEISHQLDFDVGFNLAPDYAGAGFSRESAELASFVRTGTRPPMDLQAAQQVERLLFKSYEIAIQVTAFTAPEVSSPAPQIQTQGSRECLRVLDIRELAPSTVNAFLGASGPRDAWDGFVVTTEHLAAAGWAAELGARLRVTVPDFLAQSRLLMSGQFVKVLKRLGISGFLSAGLAATPAVFRARGVSFWAAALGLLAGELAGIPRSFAGTLLLHGYLTDIAAAVGKFQELDRMLNLCRSSHPHARIGFHTNLASALHAGLPFLSAKVDEVSALSAPGGLGLTERFAGLQSSGARVSAEVGPAPAFIHQFAAAKPAGWLHGSDTIVLGPAAEPTLLAGLSAERKAAWGIAFPGLEMPATAL